MFGRVVRLRRKPLVQDRPQPLVVSPNYHVIDLIRPGAKHGVLFHERGIEILVRIVTAKLCRGRKIESKFPVSYVHSRDWKHVMAKLVVVPNYHITADSQIIIDLGLRKRVKP